MTTEIIEDSNLTQAAAEADLIAGVAAADPAAAEVVPESNFLTEAAGAVEMFAAFLVGFCPDCAKLWDKETKDRISAALAPVLEKYGFSFGNMPPEVLLIIVAGPVLWQSANTIAAYNAAKKAIAEAQEKSKQDEAKAAGRTMITRPTASQKVETPNVEVHPQMALYNQ